MRPFYIILYLLACISIGAISDSLNDSGTQTWGHLFDAVEIALLISGAFLFKLTRRDWLAYFLSYVFLRVASFDYIYNLVSGLSLFYTGVSNWWDIFLSKFPAHGVTFARFIFLVAGVAIPIKELKYKS